MSTRTVIEINHDYLSAHTNGGNFDHVWHALLKALGSGGPTEAEKQFMAACGLRVLGQRHHSETLKLTVP